MPIQTILIAKFSDLLGGGSRSPSNYFQMLESLGGMTPLNVFSTISNACTIGAADLEVQASMEAELLSESLRSKLNRYRGGHRDAPMVGFTAAGALLNLRVLLGMPREGERYRATAVGACALHANDYIETNESGKLSKGILPVVAEFAAMAELNNPRALGPVLRRAYFLYSRYLKRDESIRSLVRNELGVEIEEVSFSGLSYEAFFPFLFGLHTAARSGVLKQRTSILDAEDVAAKANVSEEAFRTFAASKVLTLEEALAQLGPIGCWDDLSRRVTDPSWVADLLIFRKKPLILLPDGRYLVPSLQLLIENASAGLTWNLMELLSRSGRVAFMTLWGTIFERYAQDLLAHYSINSIRRNVLFAGGDIDVLVELPDAVLLFEIKSGVVAQEIKGSRDAGSFGEEIRKKYVEDQKGNRKGVRQLIASVRALLDGALPSIEHRGRRVFPILIAEDPVMQTFAMNRYLNDLFRAEFGVHQEVAPLTLMIMDELEEILPFIHAGDASWDQLLSARFAGSSVLAHPMHTEFADWFNSKARPARDETFLREAGNELTSMIEDTYAGLKH